MVVRGTNSQRSQAMLGVGAAYSHWWANLAQVADCRVIDGESAAG